MPRSKSSKQWLQEHFTDPYVKKAQMEGYRSRAVYKLQEIDAKEQLIKPGMTIVDLGAAPGGWTQYVTQKLQGCGTIIALDCLPMDALPDVQFVQGDFTEETTLQMLCEWVPKNGVDLLLSDMAPNMSGSASVDIPSAMYLTELAIDFAVQMLKPGGNSLIKIFHGEGFDELIKSVRSYFEIVKVRKPKASRPRSRETYLLGKGFLKK